MTKRKGRAAKMAVHLERQVERKPEGQPTAGDGTQGQKRTLQVLLASTK